MEKDFHSAVANYRLMRARFVQRQDLRDEFEILLKFDEYTIDLWGLYQQAVVGNINVPKLDYFDPDEKSWMWGWIKGNRKWHSWNRCRGLSKSDAMYTYITRVRQLELDLPDLLEQWRDEEDPRVPDESAWVPEEERETRKAAIVQAKKERRERDAWKHNLTE